MEVYLLYIFSFLFALNIVLTILVTLFPPKNSKLENSSYHPENLFIDNDEFTTSSTSTSTDKIFSYDQSYEITNPSYCYLPYNIYHSSCTDDYFYSSDDDSFSSDSDFSSDDDYFSSDSDFYSSSDD